MSNTTIFAFTDLHLISGTRINVKSKKNNLVSVYSNAVIFEPAPANSYITFSSPTSFTFRMVKNSPVDWNGVIEYSIDRTFWNRYESDTTITSVLYGNAYNVYLRGRGNTHVGVTLSGISGHFLFLEGENISCTGNIETLLDYTTVLNGNHPNMDNYCFRCLFFNNENLITAPTLPATNLSSYCYSSMFGGCKSLKTAPELPATILVDSCYNNMFSGCTALTTPAKMADGTTQATPAKQCCMQMYNGCTSLNIYTSASGHTAFYKALTYSTSSSATNYQSTHQMFYNCYIDGVQSTTDYLTADTQYYY